MGKTMSCGRFSRKLENGRNFKQYCRPMLIQRENAQQLLMNRPDVSLPAGVMKEKLILFRGPVD